MNVWHGLGRLTSDPTIKRDIPKSNGDTTSLTKFSLAINEKIRKETGDWIDVCHFVDCVAWDSGGERIYEWFSKGMPIIVHGKIINNVYTKEGEDTPTRKVQVRVEKFEFVPKPLKEDE